MAVIAYASDPQNLLDSIRSAARSGKIETWSVDEDGDFTHSPEQWRLKAWFRPRVSEDKIVFYILTPQGKVMGKVTYAVYHGRFIEMLLGHFDTQFHRVEATALPVKGDRVRA